MPCEYRPYLRITEGLKCRFCSPELLTENHIDPVRQPKREETEYGKREGWMHMGPDHCRRNRPWIRRAGVPVNGIALVTSIVLYCLNRFVLKEAVGGWFLQCYFNDILAGVVILAYTNLLFLAVGKAEHSFRSLTTILPFTLLAGLFWEFIAPMFVKTSVTDAWDIMAYCTGGIAYWIIQRNT